MNFDSFICYFSLPFFIFPLINSKIERTLHLFYSLAWHAMSVDHGSPDITVTKQCLNRPYIVIGLQEVRGKAVAEVT